MEMRRSGTTRLSSERNLLSCLNAVAHLHEIFLIVAIERFQTVGVADDDAITVARIGLRHLHHTVEGSEDIVSRLRLQVHTRMPSSASTPVVTDNLCPRQRITPLGSIEHTKVNGKLVGSTEGVDLTRRGALSKILLIVQPRIGINHGEADIESFTLEYDCLL